MTTPMEIQINKEYKIATDNYNYILKKKGISNGEIIWTAKWFYSSLEDLYLDLFEEKILLSEKKEIKDIIDLIEKSKKEIMDYLKQLDLKKI